MNVTTSTPAQIDTEIARLDSIIAKANDAIDTHGEFLTRFAAVEGTYEANYPWFSQDKVDQANVAIADAQQALIEAVDAREPLAAEFARVGWTRYFLVTNTGGHVHWTTGCGTCFPTTQFAWLTDYSGMSHADFVQEAGALACTVCFPDAPVEQKTRINYEPAEKKARREERERKAAEKAAAEIRVEGWVDWSSRPGKTFKSVRALTNAIASDLGDLVIYGTEHPSSEQWLGNVEAGRKALAERGEDYDCDKALTNARKRYVREAAKYGNTVEPKF